MSKITLIVALVVFVIVALMFDLFGSRELLQSGVDATQSAVEKIEDTGDRVSEAVETFNDAKDEVKKVTQ